MKRRHKMPRTLALVSRRATVLFLGSVKAEHLSPAGTQMLFNRAKAMRSRGRVAKRGRRPYGATGG